MSFRDLRNFTEIMRALAYPRRISVDNFRNPNFELVADCLYWMVKRYDPTFNIGDDIDTEDDRVNFITGISRQMLLKARVKLNCKKLYAADGRAVKELLKLARILYDAHQYKPSEERNEPDTAMTNKAKDVKGARALAPDITESGAKLYDLLGSELELREERTRALSFLDAISNTMASTNEHQFIERKIKDLISGSQDQMDTLKRQLGELSQDQKALNTKLKKKQQDLDRNEKRLKSLSTVRPAFMDEYEKHEQELQHKYQIYLQKFRNLDYLEHELQLLNKAEEGRMADKDRQMARLQKRLRDEELRILRGGNAGKPGQKDLGQGKRIDDRPNARKHSRGDPGGRRDDMGRRGDVGRRGDSRGRGDSRDGRRGKTERGRGGQVIGDMRGGDEDSFSASQSLSDEGSSEGQESDDEVSLGSGGDDSLLSDETGEDESEFSDEGSQASDSADFSDDSDDEGF